MEFRSLILTAGQLIAPLVGELILLTTAFLLLGMDIVDSHQGYRFHHRRWALYVAIAGLVLASLAVLGLGNCNARIFYVLICDNFTTVVKVMVGLAVIVLAMLSDDYIRKYSRESGVFYALLIFSTLSIFLLVSSVNLIMFLLVFEFLSLLSYALTGFLHYDQRSAEAAFKYLLYGSTHAVVMLFGLSWLYGMTGTADMQSLAVALKSMESWLASLSISPSVLTPIMVLVAAGLSYKMAAVPFHQWAPDAYEGAPTPVTAFLSIGPKVAGFVLFVRMTVIVLPPDLSLGVRWRLPLLACITVASMTLGNLSALAQGNMKRLMAYSGIAQVGYVLIGITVSTLRGMSASLLYMLAYVLTDLGVFAAIIAFSNQTGSDVIDTYRGLWHRAPGITVALVIGLFSLGGIPGTLGFIGKLWLFSAAIEADLTWLAVLGVVNSVISLGYYLRILRIVYMKSDPVTTKIEPTPLLSIVLIFCTTSVVLLGFFPGIVLPIIQKAAEVAFGG